MISKEGKSFFDWTEEMIANTEYWVEANSNEDFHIWKEYGPEGTVRQYDWQQECGCVIPLGKVMDDMPVNLSINWVYLNKKLIGFYYGCSMVVDHRLINKFLENKKHVDALNFHNCIIDLFERN